MSQDEATVSTRLSPSLCSLSLEGQTQRNIEPLQGERNAGMVVWEMVEPQGERSNLSEVRLTGDGGEGS